MTIGEIILLAISLYCLIPGLIGLIVFSRSGGNWAAYCGAISCLVVPIIAGLQYAGVPVIQAASIVPGMGGWSILFGAGILATIFTVQLFRSDVIRIGTGTAGFFIVGILIFNLWVFWIPAVVADTVYHRFKYGSLPLKLRKVIVLKRPERKPKPKWEEVVKEK